MGSPTAPRFDCSFQLRLEREAQRELHIATLKRASVEGGVEALFDRYRRAELRIRPAIVQVVVAMVEEIVSLSAELQCRSLGQLERLVRAHIEAVVARSPISVASQHIRRECAHSVAAARVVGHSSPNNVAIDRGHVGSVGKRREVAERVWLMDGVDQSDLRVACRSAVIELTRTNSIGESAVVHGEGSARAPRPNGSYRPSPTDFAHSLALEVVEVCWRVDRTK